jgi:sRNA-binding regulator protein Hfq
MIMKRNFKISLLVISVLALIRVPKISYTEIIYLKDGQVLRGAITHEEKESVTIKTKHQVRKIYRDHIKRILYGDRPMEKIHILLRNGKILKGFLVDQDAEKVIFRKMKDSAEEMTIRKFNIKQISPDEIRLLSPDIFFRFGYYFPMSKGRTGLSISPIYTLGSGINFIWIKRTRVELETGFSRIRGKNDKDKYLQIIPVSLRATHAVPFSYVTIIPVIGAGYALLEFKDSENNKSKSYDPTASIGIGMEYPLMEKRFNIGVRLEYNMIFEKDTVFKSVIARAGIDFLF